MLLIGRLRFHIELMIFFEPCYLSNDNTRRTPGWKINWLVILLFIWHISRSQKSKRSLLHDLINYVLFINRGVACLLIRYFHMVNDLNDLQTTKLSLIYQSTTEMNIYPVIYTCFIIAIDS